jgi:hypothetical protein
VVEVVAVVVVELVEVVVAEEVVEVAVVLRIRLPGLTQRIIQGHQYLGH